MGYCTSYFTTEEWHGKELRQTAHTEIRKITQLRCVRIWSSTENLRTKWPSLCHHLWRTASLYTTFFSRKGDSRMTLRMLSDRHSRPSKGWRLEGSIYGTGPHRPQRIPMGKLPNRGWKRHSTRTRRIHQGWIMTGRMERWLGKINRKTRPLSRSLPMTRKTSPEQIWLVKKNMCKQQREMLDFTRRDRTRSIYTKLMMIKRCKMNRHWIPFLPHTVWPSLPWGATDDTPRSQVTPKSMLWTTSPVFTNTKLSENLKYTTPQRVSKSSSSPVNIHENRMSNGSLKQSPATTTPRSDVKREVLITGPYQMTLSMVTNMMILWKSSKYQSRGKPSRLELR